MEILRKKFRQKEMLKDRVQDRLSSSAVFQNKIPKERKLIKARFAALIDEIPDQKPNHPPYSEMIQRAIETLKEEGGSSETSISNYITSTYEQLPWAHSRLLAHHLCKFTESGGLTVASIPHYSLSLSNPVNQQQPNSDDDDDDDNYNPSFPETIIRARPTGKTREEHLSHTERRKKFRFERQETQKEVQVETEKQPLLLQWPESQRRQRSRPNKNGGRQHTHPGKAMVRTGNFDGEGSIFPSSEPWDVGSGKKVMVKASNMEFGKNIQRKLCLLRLFEQKKPEEVRGIASDVGEASAFNYEEPFYFYRW